MKMLIMTMNSYSDTMVVMVTIKVLGLMMMRRLMINENDMMMSTKKQSYHR